MSAAARSLLLLGGARSGKSALAQGIVADAARSTTASDRAALPVSVCVTAVETDSEMRDRIAQHRDERPAHWHTVEAPYELAQGVATVPTDHLVLIDCVTVWLGNMMFRGLDETAIEAQVERLADAVVARTRPTVVVSNEVGMGVVPVEPMGRAFRDIQGRANRTLADALDQAALVVAGRALRLDDAHQFPTLHLG